MTNHWRDIRHADLILINGANPAEAHPVGFQWMMRAKLERGAKMIHADPRFTRTSAVADTHLRIRTGTDVAYFGGLINYVLQNELYHKEYVQYGMNAERGHANIQGNTDHAISWDILPGYLRIPAPGQHNLTDYVAQSASKKLLPTSLNFFGDNYRKFMVSLLKAWYGDKATNTNEFAFDYLPKPASNASWLSIFDQALRGKMEGLMLSGMTATSIGPDSNQVLKALSSLKWLCVMDAFATTSSEFWRAPGIDPSTVQTEVLMLPATHWIEKDGSFTNSGRWSQWKDQVLPPQGEARHDHWILAETFQRIRDLYQQQGGKFPAPVLDLTFPYRDARKPELDEIAKEINGYDLTTGKRLATFAGLKDDGTTTAGDWIYTGHYPESGNLTKRRDGIQDPKKNDPTGMGFYPNWAWAWPLNRRVLYNRASADPLGRPWDPKRPGIQWNAAAAKWVGDVPDYPPTADPTKPGAPLPFIMTGEGTGRLFSNGVADGPFPEHYEPVESPIDNPLHPSVSATPVAFLYDKAAGRPDRFGSSADYPYVATSYRLTEHEHYITQQVEHLVQLQPEAFVEVPAELAREKGIKTGDHVRVSSKRGKLEVRAVVTKRLGALQIDGKKIYQIGIPIHWGFVGINTGQHWLANALTPFVGDASARTPEFKAFLVNIEKM